MIYLNHAATSFPKFPEVIAAVNDALVSGASLGNRDSVSAVEQERKMFELRERISLLLGAKAPHTICFTPRNTIAMNHIVNSLSGGIVVTSSVEHNSVARPLAQAVKRGKIEKVVSVSSLDELEDVIKTGKVCAGIFAHASNVTGDVIDAEAIGKKLYNASALFVLDVAQSAGIIPINVDAWNVDALAFAGHKALGGPQGTGGLYVRNGFPISPVLFGGTGNSSFSVLPEIVLPESIEVGTPSSHDLMGLAAALEKIFAIGLENYAKESIRLAQRTADELRKIKGITVFGEKKKQIPVVSFVVDGHDIHEIGAALAKKEIVCRVGAHCSANAMKTLNVQGTVRVSFGYTNSDLDVDVLLDVIRNL